MVPVIEQLREHLAPRYQVERQIGAGGMARVYLATERHPRRPVAIKILEPDVSTGLLYDRFIREVELSSRLNHPHIVPIFAAGDAGGLLYYVMPYIEGESLRQRLVKQGALPLEEALHIALDIADALGYAHAQASCTATSSRKTSCSRAAMPSWLISASPAPSAPPAAVSRSRRRVTPSAPRAT